MTEPEVRVTEYEVSVLPRDDINQSTYAVAVTYRGEERWAVLHHRFCLGTDGEWSWESLPSERADEWLATHRFPLEEALRLAKEAAPLVEVNGRTAQQVADRSRIC